MPGVGSASGTVTFTTACILVIEDEPSIRSFLRTLLNDEGYRVETAIDGLDALQRLGCAPDLILLDLGMPVMDGYEFLARLRNLTTHSRTPVLVVSANTNGSPIDGAQGVLPKPFEVATLLGHVSGLLRSWPLA